MNYTKLGALVALGIVATNVTSLWASHGSASGAQQVEQTCEVKSIYELKESSDGKRLEVFNEAGELVSTLTIAQLAGFDGKPRRLLQSSCPSLADRNLLRLIEENRREPSQEKDPHAEFLVYTASTGDIKGLKFYEFDRIPRTHQNAIIFCESKNLRLMDLQEAFQLQAELNNSRSKREKWGLGRGHWTSNVYSSVPDHATTIAVGSGRSYLPGRFRGDGKDVRCVGR